MEEGKYMYRKEILCECEDCICVFGNEHSGSIKDGHLFMCNTATELCPM